MTLPPGAGPRDRSRRLTSQAQGARSNQAVASTVEVVVSSGFDVGAHVHRAGQELFYVLEGELGLLAFEPQGRTQGD